MFMWPCRVEPTVQWAFSAKTTETCIQLVTIAIHKLSHARVPETVQKRRGTVFLSESSTLKENLCVAQLFTVKRHTQQGDLRLLGFRWEYWKAERRQLVQRSTYSGGGR